MATEPTNSSNAPSKDLSPELQKTPLCEDHIRLGGKMVPFAGWYMPVEYEGLRAEHSTVRTHVGLFDVSHMGELRVRGPKALATLQWLTTNDVAALENGKAQYGLLPNANGGLVDDLIVYCLEKNSDYLVCVNAANTKKDWDWFVANNQGADLTNESHEWGQIAVQGPKALELCKRLFTDVDFGAPAFTFFTVNHHEFGKCLVALTGYTGEKGCEIFVPREFARALWNRLLEVGQPLGVKPIGLGARDTLRTEMKYSLYGHEITDTTFPHEAGLGWVVKADKKEFIGKSKILAAKANMTRKLVCIKLTDKGIARAEYKVLSSAGATIGYVTSGTLSPSLGVSIAIAYVATEFAKTGTEVAIDIRGRPAKAVVVDAPFVKTSLAKN
jgi:aminomethyltransferase